MTAAIETIDHATLEHLAAAHAVTGACVVGKPGGWGVFIKYGTAERALAVKRGAMRIFRKFETLALYLQSLGIVEYQMDSRQFDPAKISTTPQRTDAAERMKSAHAAAAYKGWLTKEVQEAIDDPRPSIPHDVVMAEWKTERAALAKKAKPTKSAGH